MSRGRGKRRKKPRDKREKNGFFLTFHGRVYCPDVTFSTTDQCIPRWILTHHRALPLVLKQGTEHRLYFDEHTITFTG
jgi:hypothetical protein